MIRINLLPSEEAGRAAGRRQDIAVGALVLGGVALLLVAAHTWQQARIMAANRGLRRVEQELTAIQGPYADATRMELQKKELRDKLRVIGELEQKKVGPVKMLADLSSSTPDKLWLTDFDETNGAVKLSGLGVDEQTVADFMRRLGTSSVFRSVDLSETSLVTQEGMKQKKFVIVGQVSYLPGQAETASATPAPGAGRGAKP
jgi:type IV pilus assembly protein PilN